MVHSWKGCGFVVNIWDKSCSVVWKTFDHKVLNAYIITVPADGLAHNGARSPATAMLTTKLDMFSHHFSSHRLFYAQKPLLLRINNHITIYRHAMMCHNRPDTGPAATALGRFNNIDSRYIAVIDETIVHTAQQAKDKTSDLYSRTTPPTPPYPALTG